MAQDERIEMLDSADELVVEGRWGEAIPVYNDIINGHNDSLAMVSYVRIAQIYIFDNPKEDSSTYYLNKLKDICEYTGNKRCFILLSSINNFVSKQKQDYVSAISHSEEAIENLDHRNDDLWFNVYNNYANTFDNLSEYALARENYKQALKSTYPISREDSLLAWINISSTFRSMPDSVIYYSNNGLTICRSQILSRSCQMLFNNIAWAFAEKKEFQAALDLVNIYSQDSIQHGSSDIEFSPALTHTTGYLYLKLKQYEESISYFKTSLPLAIESNNIPLILRNLKDLSEAYYKTGDINQSYIYQTEQIKYANILHKEEIKSEIIRYENSKSLQEKNKKISTLEQESTTILGNNRKLKIGMFSLLIASIIGGLVFIVKQQLDRIKLAQLNEEISLSKLVSLSATMNPHFLFNAFNNLQNFILKNDQDKAELYIGKLSGLLRRILSHSDDVSILLNDEIELLNSYFILEKERFHNKVLFTIDVDENLLRQNPHIPAMILQPHVENAILHGVSSLNTEGIIEVFLKKDGMYINCIVKDNGIGRDRSSQIKNKAAHNSIATKNTKRRIEIFTKLGYKRAEMRIVDVMKDGSPHGTEVHLLLPLLKNIKNGNV